MSKNATRGDYRWWDTLTTRWMDCDAYGHVNNVNYYSFFDIAVTRMLYARAVLGPTSPSIGLCVESACGFHRPIEFPQSIDAGVRIGSMGGKSVRYEIGLFISGEDMPAATGHFVHVYVDRATRRPTPIMAEHRADLAQLLVDPD